MSNPGCSTSSSSVAADQQTASPTVPADPNSSEHCAAVPLLLQPFRQCRICLLSNESRRKQLVAPCRCSGTIQHVHIHCLAHWIEVSSRKTSTPAHCELCGYRYRRRPFVDLTRIHLPYMDLRDRVLNSLCLLLLLIMGFCAWVAAQHLQVVEKRPHHQPALSRTGRGSRVALSQPDLTVLLAVLLLFAAFFLAMFTQYRAEVTVFRVLSRLWETNRNWRIRDYCPKNGDLPSGRSKKLGEEERRCDSGQTMNDAKMTNQQPIVVRI